MTDKFVIMEKASMAGRVLLPSKKNPRVKRWFRTGSKKEEENIREYGYPRRRAAGGIARAKLAKQVLMAESSTRVSLMHSTEFAAWTKMKANFAAHGIKEVFVEGRGEKKEDAVDAVINEIDKIENRLGAFDGKGLLTVSCGKALAGHVKAAYDSFYVILRFSAAYEESAAHEYGHFLWYESIFADSYRKAGAKGKEQFPNQIVSTQGGFISTYKDMTDQQVGAIRLNNYLIRDEIQPRIQKKLKYVRKDSDPGGISSYLNDITDEIINFGEERALGQPKSEVSPQKEAYRELMYALNDYYARDIAKNPFYDRYSTKYMAYCLDPNEMFARAIGNYVEQPWKDPVAATLVKNEEIKRVVEKEGYLYGGFHEGTEEYQKIISDWVDKYVKTGIVKSFVIEKSKRVFVPAAKGRKAYYRTDPRERKVELDPRTAAEEEITDLVQRCNFKKLYYKPEMVEDPTKVLQVLTEHLQKLEKTLQVDGRGELSIEIGDLSGTSAGASYFKHDITIKIDKKYLNTFSHEYGHFLYDKDIGDIEKNFEMPLLRLIETKEDLTEDRIRKMFENWATTWVPKNKAGQAYKELVTSLGSYYAKNVETLRNYPRFVKEIGAGFQERVKYFFDLNEMFARAVDTYVEKAVFKTFAFVDNNEEYYSIVNAWGDKYLKTGIVKAIPQTAARLVIIETDYGPYDSWAAFPATTRPIRARGTQTPEEKEKEDELDKKVNKQTDETRNKMETATSRYPSYGTPGVETEFIKAEVHRRGGPRRTKHGLVMVKPHPMKVAEDKQPWLEHGFADIAKEQGKRIDLKGAVAAWQEYNALPEHTRNTEIPLHRQYLKEVVESFLGSSEEKGLEPEDITAKLAELSKEIGKSYVILEKSRREKPFFTYTSLANEKWNELTREAMKTFKVFFDLENNDPKVNREIVVPQNEWKPIKCKFKCEMWRAGGDWQIPVLYFKCQLIEGYAFGVETYRDSGLFVYIPGKTEGNSHLTPGKEGKWYAPDDEHYKKEIDPEPNERKCWESLNKYLKELVDKEVEKVKAERPPEQRVEGEELGKGMNDWIRKAAEQFIKNSMPITKSKPGLVLVPSKKNPRVKRWMQMQLPFEREMIEEKKIFENTKDYFESGQIVKHKKFDGGANETVKIQIKDDGNGILKPAKGEYDGLRSGIKTGSYYVREAAAYSVAKIVGMDDMVPETYIRKDPKYGKASVQQWIEHADNGRFYDVSDVDDDSIARAAIFDFVLGNTDRYSLNWLQLPEFNDEGRPLLDVPHKLFLIDNGLILSTRKFESRMEFLGEAQHRRLNISWEEVDKYKNNWPQIAGTLQAMGIEIEAINDARERLALFETTRQNLEHKNALFGGFEELQTVYDEWKYMEEVPPEEEEEDPADKKLSY